SVQGVVITDVGANSPLYDQNVRPGDVVTEVNGHEVGDIAQFETEVRKAKSGSYLRFYIQRFDPQSRQQLSFFAVVRVP
ncbi:MAG TPA: PDZ domain-containing protein, partial [Thermoanaerobaculia bacterium]|nr:PDZ domain-containing protein [Thermoanaerobaculia bacterium]